MPFSHNDFRKLFKKMGYTSTELSGVCQGFTMRFIEACLLGEEDVFIERIKLIDAYQKDLDVSYKEALKNNGSNVTPSEKNKILNIVAFMDSLFLYQQPEFQYKLFGKPVIQADIEMISLLASSDSIQARGGLVKIFSDSDIFSQEDLYLYLTILASNLDSCDRQPTDTFCFKFSSLKHTIAVIYRPFKGWIFMNINDYPPKTIMKNQSEELVERIFCSFKDSVYGQYQVLNISCLTTKNMASSFSHISPLDGDEIKLTIIHYIRKKIVSLDSNILSFFICLAAYNNQIYLINQLIELGVKLNKLEYVGVTPARIAVKNGNLNLLRVLAKNGANLNEAGNNGTRPVHIAAFLGHTEILRELADKEVDLGIARTDGLTAAAIAAYHGHIDALRVLIEAGVDINQSDNNGATPTYFAAQNGYTGIIKLLVKAGADLNQTDNDGVTPLIIAVENAHFEVVRLLAKADANLNQPDNDGVTPLFIAVKHASFDIIRLLVEFGADLSIPTPINIEDLRAFTINFDEAVKQRVDFFIKKNAVPDQINIDIKPDEFSWILWSKHIETKEAEKVQGRPVAVEKAFRLFSQSPNTPPQAASSSSSSCAAASSNSFYP